jgi:hypothetical protein
MSPQFSLSVPSGDMPEPIRPSSGCTPNSELGRHLLAWMRGNGYNLGSPIENM